MAHWTGLQLGNLEIGEAIGDGAFSRIYRAKGTDGGQFALKVAGSEFSDGAGATGFYQSRALEQITSGFAEFAPAPMELLQKQYEYLTELQGTDQFVRVFDLERSSEYSYMRMEYLAGKNLRQHILDGSAGLAIMLPFLSAMEQLEKNKLYRGHGDLKPENMIIADAKLKLIDPGFYGRLTGKDGRQYEAAVTTPAYYPGLDGDDLFAAGIILWELVCGEQVLNRQAEPLPVGPMLEEKLLQLERTGNHYFSNLRSVRAPKSINPHISPELSAVLCKALRLSFGLSGKQPELAVGFKSFAEFNAELKAALLE